MCAFFTFVYVGRVASVELRDPFLIVQDRVVEPHEPAVFLDERAEEVYLLRLVGSRPLFDLLGELLKRAAVRQTEGFLFHRILVAICGGKPGFRRGLWECSRWQTHFISNLTNCQKKTEKVV
jgi:hypothetical protein